REPPHADPGLGAASPARAATSPGIGLLGVACPFVRAEDTLGVRKVALLGPDRDQLGQLDSRPVARLELLRLRLPCERLGPAPQQEERADAPEPRPSELFTVAELASPHLALRNELEQLEVPIGVLEHDAEVGRRAKPCMVQL